MASVSRHRNARPAALALALALCAALSAAHATADAPAGRYVIQAGTVYDTKTKLTWEQNYDDASSYGWSEAKAHCTSLAGVGWRLPSLKELQTIVDYTLARTPAIDGTAFSGTVREHFWSSTAFASGGTNAWYVDFTNGSTSFDKTAYGKRVRCVR